MDNPTAVIKSLLELGDQFTYENFSSKGSHGYPDSYSPEWVAWKARVSGITTKLFGEDSAVEKVVTAATRVPLIGNGPDKFEHAKSHFMAALTNALEVLSEDTFGELANQQQAIAPSSLTNKVFIVHGHDAAAKGELEALLKEMGLEPVVLHRQADSGKTIIEKFEHHADVGFAFILLTPDEIAYLAKEDDLRDDQREKEYRARPNVIFEFGYFVGRLGRERTCCIYRGETVVPSDLDGLLYKKYSQSVEEVAYGIQKELKAAGYKLT